MLGDNDAISTIATRDLKAAKQFYEGKLGLKPTHSQEKEVLGYQTGRSKVMVYRSQYAGTNKATAVTWVVDDVEEIVRTLKGKGVVFGHYDLPGLTLKGDIHAAGNFKTAWFKDPDGNILALVSK